MDPITAQAAGAEGTVNAPVIDIPIRTPEPREGQEAHPDLAAIKNIVGVQLDALRPRLKGADAPPAPAAAVPPSAPAAAVPPSAPAAAVPPSAPAVDDDFLPADLSPEPAPTIPAPTVPVPDPAEPPEPPEVSKDVKAKHSWAQMRALVKSASDKAAALEKLAEERRKEAADIASALAAEKKTREGVEARFEQIALAESPTFRAKFDGRMEAMRADLQNTISQFIEDPALAAPLADKLLRVPVKEFVSETSKLSGPMASVITGAAAAARAGYAQLAKERADAIDNWRASKQAISEEAARQGRVKVVEEIDKSAEAAFEQVAKGGNFLFQRSASNAEWNAQVDARMAAAKQTLLMARSPQELVSLIVEGLSAAETRKLYSEAVAANRDLKARLAAAGQPVPSRVRPSAPPPTPALAEPAKPAKADPRATVDDLFRKAGFRR